ncbi:MAG: hypothetical protein HUU46_00875 [Candidatus Hydrogenedentes bacterium]|nr:hypothetical protein [Candidatus Hydrogenedentota bacterium]
MNPIAAILILCAAMGEDTRAYEFAEEIAGTADCVAFAGNGSLTVGIGATGGVAVVRWPDPTAPNQVTPEVEHRMPGAMWGVVRGDGIGWLPFSDGAIRVVSSPGDAPVIAIEYELGGAMESVFVHPELDVAVFHVEFKRETTPPAVAWFANFSPCTASMPGVPSSEALFPSRRDMIAFAENGVTFHARPDRAGNLEWTQTQAWTAGDKEPDWFKKGRGVWIGYAGEPQCSASVCGQERGEPSALALAESGAWNQDIRCVGACASASRMAIDPNRPVATMFVALGENRGSAQSALSTARERGYERLLDETKQWWANRLTNASLSYRAPDAIGRLYRRALQNVLLCTDIESGAIARAPHSTPPLAVDFPRLAGWTALALDLAGESELVDRQLKFIAAHVRAQDAPGAPAGSLPAALYATGDDAAPSVVLDVHAPAWLLWTIWRHDANVADDQREDYRAKMRNVVDLAGDFLANTCRSVRDTRVFTFDPARLSDAASFDTIAIACAGLRAATSFAQATGNDQPEWAARVIELEDYLRFHALDTAGNFRIADPVALWPTELIGVGDPRWAGHVQAAIDDIPSYTGPAALKTLANAAMLLRDQKDKLAVLRPLVEPTVQRVFDVYPCDSYYSALAMAVISIVYSA